MPTNASILADWGSGIGTAGPLLRLDSVNDRVGIGTTNPTETLDVNGTVKANNILIAGIETASTSATFGTVQITSGIITATSGIITYYGDGSQLTGIDATALKDSDGIVKVQANESGIVVSGISTFESNVDISGDLNFNGTLYQNNSQFIASRWTAGEGDEIYRLSNIGIGTTNPTTNLDVNGDVRVSGVSTIGQLHNSILVNYSERVNVIGTTGPSVNINIADGTYVTATLDQDAAFDFTPPPSGSLYGFALALTNSGGPWSITWPVTVQWPANVIPVRTTDDGKTDLWAFTTVDGGSTWYGSISLYNFG